MINWVKNNKILTVILVIVAYFGLQLSQSFYGINTLSLKTTPQSANSFGSAGVAMESFSGARDVALPNVGVYTPDYTPQTNSTERLVVQSSNISLLVKDVVETRNTILDFTSQNGGYMVTASTSNPQDAPTGNITIRIPSDRLQKALDYFHSLSIKVVSENIIGTDVTDQYVDIDTRIAQIERAMLKLEEILNQSTKISDITSLTQQILSYQNQVDSLKGQQESLKQNANLAKITIYLSTDEIALPYAPSETFRPQVIFKLAVRSLVSTLRDLAEISIWIGVYSVIWIPGALIFIFVRKWLRNKKNVQ